MDQYTADLLTKWGLSDYISAFDGGRIDSGTLSMLGPEEIHQLIPIVGDRAKFRFNLQNWKRQMHLPNASHESTIKDIFQKEAAEVYYTPYVAPTARTIARNASGKLLRYVYNRRRVLRDRGIIAPSTRSSSSRPSASSIEVLTPTDPEEVSEKLTFLRNSIEPWTLVELNWRETASCRLRTVSTGGGSLEAYFTQFPALKRPCGYTLLMLDFNYLFPHHEEKLFNNLVLLREKIFELARKKIKVIKDRDLRTSIQGYLDFSTAKEWWENAQLYQIYPRSFKDSNGDGIGDLKGITEKLDHFTDAGVQGIWLSPIYASPMVDFGYDISDFTAINPEYGTMADFEDLQAKCKKLGIKLILDFVPNHTSDDHEWFKKSAARVSGFEDYYIWADGVQDPQNASKLLPPSNWISIFYGSAWTWHEGRKQFYFHTFHVRQPDINYRDPGLVEDMKEVLRFWLNKGVHGFRVDAIPFLFEVDKNKFGGKYPDEPLSGMTDDPNDYNHLLHPHTKDQPETYEMVMQWRAVLDDYSEKNDKSVRILMMEAYTTIEEQMKYYGNVTHPGAQFPFNFNFITDLNKGSDANDIDRAVHSFADKLGPGFHGANWVIGNHDNSRVTTRYGEERVDGISMIINLLPGVGVTYQGDELAMEDQFLTWEQTKDPQACNTNPDVYAQMSRDPARTPFQWDASANAGFSTSNLTWLPVATNYKTLNLKAQIDAPRSHFKTYQALSKLRREFTIMHGDLNTHVHNDATVFSFKRSLTGFPDYVVIANIRNTTTNLSLKNPYPSLKTEVIVVVSSLKSSRNIGDMVNSANLTLDPYEALVLKSD